MHLSGKRRLFLLARLFILFSSTSFIHPDEHFQNTQIAIQDVFKPSHPLLRTWEWDPSRLSNSMGGGPIRSIVPLWLTSHLGFRILKLASTLGWINVSPRLLVITPRLLLYLLSILVDRFVFHTFHQSPELQLLYLSSLSSLLFICRTFSNSLESILFTTIFILSLSIVNNSNKNKKTETLSIIVWTLLNLLTVFVRVSYICIGLPLVIMIFYTRILPSFHLFIVTGSTALIGLTTFIYFDSLYFDRWPTIAPISFLLYNSNPQNLAQHGTHPYFLHLFINGPILFGPALWFSSWWQICFRLKSNLSSNTVKLSMASVISGTLLLSLQPHQEPRFLLPLALPLTILSFQSKSKSKLSKSFWVIHLLHSLITVILFGYLHQGGLQLALEALPPQTELLFSYKTFDIPSSIIIFNKQISRVENLRGTTEKVLIEKLCQLGLSSLNEDKEIILIAPRWAIDKKIQIQNWITLLFSSKFPHLDLDRLDEIYMAGVNKLGIGLYQIHLKNLLASKLCEN